MIALKRESIFSPPCFRIIYPLKEIHYLFSLLPPLHRGKIRQRMQKLFDSFENFLFEKKEKKYNNDLGMVSCKLLFICDLLLSKKFHSLRRNTLVYIGSRQAVERESILLYVHVYGCPFQIGPGKWGRCHYISTQPMIGFRTKKRREDSAFHTRTHTHAHTLTHTCECARRKYLRERERENGLMCARKRFINSPVLIDCTNVEEETVKTPKERGRLCVCACVFEWEIAMRRMTIFTILCF